jgi:hypothetical protein
MFERKLHRASQASQVFLLQRFLVTYRKGGSDGRPTTRWSAVGGGLDAVQLRVRTALRHQRIVRADLHEPGTVEHDNEIGHANRRETVGDEDGDAAAVVLAGVARRCRELA